MPIEHDQLHDLVEPPRPRAPERLSCAVCRREIPPDGGHTREYGDYTLWFCSADCYDKSANKSMAEPGHSQGHQDDHRDDRPADTRNPPRDKP